MRTFNISHVHTNEVPHSGRWGRPARRGVERVLNAILIGLVVSLAGGCGVDSGTNPMPGESVSLQQFTVDQTGGTIVYRSTIQDVTVTLTIPPGALDSSTIITIDHAQVFPTASGLVTGAIFEFGPNGLVFNSPVDLSIGYSASMVGTLSESNFRIHHADGSNWTSLLGTVDTANKIVTATITGFSIYGLKTIPNSGGGGTGGGDPGGGGTGSGGTGGGGTDPSAIIPTWYGVQANILQPFCTGCHAGSNPPAGLSWEVDQYDPVVTQGRLSTEISTMLEVNPGNPDASYLIWKLRGQGPGGEAIQGVRMPATGIALDPALIDVVAQWISDGVPLGDPTDADSGGSSTPTFPVGSWMYVWTETLQVCTLCHSNTPSSSRCGVDFSCPPKGVVLTVDNYNGVVDDDEVEPFDLSGSKLWKRVTDSDPDKRMPFGLDPLSQNQLDIISNWITNGAPFCPANEVCP